MIASSSVRRASAARKAVVVLPLLAALLAGCGTAAKNDTFDLSAISKAEGPSARGKQILIPQPTALGALDREQIVVRVTASQIQYLAKAQWSDKLSRMVQSKFVTAFENSREVGGVGVPGQGLAIDYQVVTDIRSFEIDVTQHVAVVEISAKILNDRNGTIIAQNVFRRTSPLGGAGNEDYIRALDRAFALVTSDIVAWTLRAI